MKKKQTDQGAFVKASSDMALAKPDSDTKLARPRIRRTGPGVIEVVAEGLDTLLPTLCASTGTSRELVAIRLAGQIETSLVLPRPKDAEESLTRAISTIAEIAPQNVTEAMLATQMIATHEAALRFLEIANRPDQTIDGGEATMRWAARLMRLHLDQIEALQKLKGKAAQQKVTVEHVHVYQGGQAIVGAVNADKTGGGRGDEPEN